MKIILAVTLLMLLTSCAQIKYDELLLSSANITDVNVKNTSNDKIELIFNYDINDYNNIEGLYVCTINFVGNSKGSWLNIRRSGGMKCNISDKSGLVHFVSQTPLNKAGKFEHSRTAKFFRRPLQYFVAIEQKFGPNRKDKKQIGKSAMYILDVENTD